MLASLADGADRDRAAPGVARRSPRTDGERGVGGDWYDLFPLPGGRIGIVIGDVVGHDLPAAVTMGRLQTALRVIASTTGAGPAEVLDRLDAAVASRLPDTTFTTVGYGEYDPASGRFRYACAGHLPPLLGADGQACYLWQGLCDRIMHAMVPADLRNDDDIALISLRLGRAVDTAVG